MTEESESWVERYRPETFSDVQGNNKSLKHIKEWATNWSEGDKPQLLVGEPGTGKTSTAYVVKKKMDWEIMQINASSARKTEDLKTIASRLRVSPPGAEYQLVLLDEVDSFDSSVNLSPIKDALKNPSNPVILTANDEYSVPNSIQRRCKKHDYKLGKRSRKAKLREIAKKEDVDIDAQQIGKLATRPDLRSAINDLQLYAESGNDIDWDQRNWDQSEFDAVDNILRGKKYVGDNITPPDLLHWLDENIAKSFRGIEQAQAYDSLSRADKWLGRVNESQNYRFWKYAGELMESTADLRLSEPWDGYIKKDFPEYWRHSTTKVTEDSNEAKLFRQLSAVEDGPFRLGGNYIYFRECLLPILKSLDKEDKYGLCLNARLDEDAMKAIGVEKEAFDNWRTEEWEEGFANQSSAMEW